MDQIYKTLNEYVTTDVTGIRKSKLSKTNFSHVELKNKARVVFTENVDTKHKKKHELLAVVCLAVNVGSIHEPKQLDGLAHYLEHMVFMGSAKYPDEHDFDEYVAKHGGYANAYTSESMTLFWFGIFVDHFKEAFDKFINFFVDPLFIQDCLERECDAVDSEYVLACSNNYYKETYLVTESLKESCLMNRFFHGNKDSLLGHSKKSGIDIRSALINFFEMYYRPELMNVCVSFPTTIDESLKQFVIDTVSAIPMARNTDITYAENILLYENVRISDVKADNNYIINNEMFMDESKYDCFYHVETERVLNRLTLHWNLPAYNSTTNLFYYNFLSWLLGHETDGSLAQYLKERGYIVKLQTDIDNYPYHFADFWLRMDLTNKGLGNIDTVVQCVFGYVEMLKTTDKWELFDSYIEMACIELVERFLKPTEDCNDLAMSIVEAVADDNLPIEHCVSGYIELRDGDENALFADFVKCMDFLIDKLDRKNLLFVLMAPESSITLVDETIQSKLNSTNFIDSKHYDVKYRFFKCDALFPNKHDSESFSLPKSNPYFKQDFDYEVQNEDNNKQKFPVKVYDDENLLEIYYKKDLKFKQAVTAVGMQFYHGLFPIQHIKSSQKNKSELLDFFVCSGLYRAIFDYLVAEQLYDASLLGYTVNFFITPECFLVDMFGFTNNMPMYVESLFTIFKRMEITESVFEQVKQKYIDNLCNSLMSREILKKTLLYLIYERHSVNAFDMVNHLKSGQVNLAKLIDFSGRLFNNGYARFLVQGSMSKDKAVELLTGVTHNVLQYESNMSNMFSLLTNKIPSNCSIRLRHANLHNKDKNSHTTLVYNFNDSSISYEERLAILDLINTIMYNCFFDQLRTKLQLSYNLNTNVASTVLGISAMTLQMCYNAKKFSSEHIQQKIEWFVRDFFYEKLKNMSEREFSEYKEACRNSFLKKPTSLKTEFRKNFAQFKNSQLNFNKRTQQAEFISSISLDQLKRLYEKIYVADAACIKVHVIANSGDAFEFQPIEFVFERGSEESIDCSDYERLYSLLIAG